MADDAESKRWGWRRALRWAALPAALLLGFLVVRTPEPARTAFALVAGVCGVGSESARARLLDTYVAERLTLELEDDEQRWSRRRLTRHELLEQLAELDLWHPRCQLELELTEVRGAQGAERLDGELLFSDSQAGDLHAEGRSVSAQFETVGGQRRLVRVLLFAPQRRLPEARP
ncbi:MAG: hypothetical protein ABI895_37780 [Deltaproteobacteria bacterium]